MKRVMIHTGSITDVIATRLELTEWGDVFTDSGIKEHIFKNHAHEMKKEVLNDPFSVIKKVIDGPDYIGKHPKHGGIEMIRNIDGQNYQVGIKYNYVRGYYFVATMHPVEQYKIINRLGERLQEINTKGEMRMSYDSKEHFERIEKGMKDYLQSDKFKDYLKFQARFHNYSMNNTWLILLQKPDATRVAGFDTWKKLGRFPEKGTGIKILAPKPYTYEKEMDVVKDGVKVKETQKMQGLKFDPVHVFDVSDTKGRELPKLVDELRGNSEQARKIIESIKSISNVPIGYETIKTAKGYYSPSENRIAISDALEQNQEAKTLVHEFAHAKMHNPDQQVIAKIGKRMCEVQAECVAFIVCERFGLDTSDYSFGYMATYSSSMEFPELKASFEKIKTTASEIIGNMENALTKQNVNVVDLKREAAVKLLIDELVQAGLPKDRAEKCAVTINDAMDGKIAVVDKTLRVDDVELNLTRSLVKDDEGLIASYGTIKDITVNGQRLEAQITFEAYDHRKSLLNSNDSPIKVLIDSSESKILWSKIESFIGKPLTNDLRRSIMLDYETANKIITETNAETMALKKEDNHISAEKTLPSGKREEMISFRIISPTTDHSRVISHSFGSKEDCLEPERVSLKYILNKNDIDLTLKNGPTPNEAKIEFMAMFNTVLRNAGKNELTLIKQSLAEGELFSSVPSLLKSKMIQRVENQLGIRSTYEQTGDFGKQGNAIDSLKIAERYLTKNVPISNLFLDEVKERCVGIKAADAKGLLKQLESGKIFKMFPDNFVKEFKNVLESLGAKTATGALDKNILKVFKETEKEAQASIKSSIVKTYEKDFPAIKNITPSAALSIHATNCSVNAVVTVSGFEKMYKEVGQSLVVEPSPEGTKLMNHLTSVIDSLKQCKQAEIQQNNKGKVMETELEMG